MNAFNYGLGPDDVNMARRYIVEERDTATAWFADLDEAQFFIESEFDDEDLAKFKPCIWDDYNQTYV